MSVVDLRWRQSDMLIASGYGGGDDHSECMVSRGGRIHGGVNEAEVRLTHALAAVVGDA